MKFFILYINILGSCLKTKVRLIFTIDGNYFPCYKGTALESGERSNFECLKVNHLLFSCYLLLNTSRQT